MFFSALVEPPRLWYESLSDFLSLRDDGAETEMVCPRGLCPVGDTGPGWEVGNSSFILDVDEDEMDALVLDATLSPCQTASPGTSLSGGAWALMQRASPNAALRTVALVKASGSVWSSGEELDLLRVVV